ncbi:MAG TPA: polysaccharide biosynthesis/export family protein [Pseudolabrys sp.]|nr:polysaccharide biosynthesis/export family protein [Pseudolabrys sp.]
MTSILRCGGSRARRQICALGLAFLLYSVGIGHAEYRVDVDDVIEIGIAGLQDLKQRVPVQVDGTISFPLLGTIQVRGLTAQELRSKIQSSLASKLFRQRGPDGRESVVVIEPDQVTASVVEFRPIFVNGDVSKPGQVPYRPLTTVRQAVALAGGYELMRFRLTNPFLEAADVRAQYDARWNEFIKEQAHVWRLRSELGKKAEFDQKSLTDAPIARSRIAEIVSREAQHMEMRRLDEQREKTFLQNSIKQASAQLTVLTELEQKEEEGAQADQQDLQRALDLFAKGSITAPRVQEARRQALFSVTRRMQTKSQLLRTQKLRDDLSRQLEHGEDQRKIDLLKELQDATVKLSELSAQIQAAEEKLRYTGVLTSQLVRGKGAKPEITVIRRSEKGYERLKADEDFELDPGDVVEVALQEPPAGVALQR